MKSQGRWCALIVCVLGTVSGMAFGRTERIRVATWNLENLFDAVDDPNNEGDDEYHPGSWRRWTPERYEEKRTHLAGVIAAMKPDILCVQELENRRALEDLVGTLRAEPFAFALTNIVHQESGDHRGIDVGILTRFPIVRWELREDVPGLRGMLVATLNADGAPLTVICCHWKSWVGDAEENVVIRLREALAVRAEVDRIRAADPEASVLVAGDFNDNYDGHSLQQGLTAYADRERVQKAPNGRLLYNALGDLPEESLGSYYFARRKVWNTFDAVILAPEMLLPLEASGPAWRLPSSGSGAVGVFRRPEMLEPDGRPKPFRRVRLQDGTDSYAEGCSDHLPVWVELVRATGRGR